MNNITVIYLINLLVIFLYFLKEAQALHFKKSINTNRFPTDCTEYTDFRFFNSHRSSQIHRKVARLLMIMLLLGRKKTEDFQ